MHDDDEYYYRCTDKQVYIEYKRNKGGLPKLRDNKRRWNLNNLRLVERHSPFLNKPEVVNGTNDTK